MESSFSRPWPISPLSTYESRSVSPIVEESESHSHYHEEPGRDHVSVPMQEPMLRSQSSKSSLRILSRFSSMPEMSCTSHRKPTFGLSTLLSRISRPSIGLEPPFKSRQSPVDSEQKSMRAGPGSFNEQFATKDNLKCGENREPDPKYLSTRARTTSKRLNISSPTNFRHLTHAGQKEFSDMTSLSQSDLIADFSAVRASQNSRADLRGIQTQELHSHNLYVDNRARSRLASETDSIRSNDVPSLASEGSQDSLVSPQTSSQSSVLGLDESTKSPPQTKPNFSFSRPFLRNPPPTLSTTDTLPPPRQLSPQLSPTQQKQPQPQTSAQPILSLRQPIPTEFEGSSDNNESNIDSFNFASETTQDEFHERIDPALHAESDVNVLSVDCSPTALFTSRTLDTVHEVGEDARIDLHREDSNIFTPQPLRIKRSAPSSVQSSESMSENTVENLKEPNPSFIISGSSRPGSGASNITIKPQSPLGDKGQVINEPIKRNNSTTSKPSVTFDKRVSVITLEEPLGLFSAWGLDEEDSSSRLQTNKVANTTTFEPLNQSASTPEDELGDDDLYDDLNDFTRDTGPQPSPSDSSIRSFNSEPRKLSAVSSMDDSLGGLRKYSDNPIVDPLEARRSSGRNLHKLHRSNNDIFQERFVNKQPVERCNSAAEVRPTSIRSRMPWSPILSKDIENRSADIGDHRCFLPRSITNRKDEYVDVSPASTKAAKTVTFEGHSGQKATQAYVSVNTLKAWEIGASRINATLPIPEPTLEEKRSLRSRFLRKRSAFYVHTNNCS